VISRVVFCAMALICAVVVLGCGAPSSPVAATPAANSAATAQVPSTAGTPLPLPAQPTAPPQAARIPSPFQSATPARSFSSAGPSPTSSGAAATTPVATSANPSEQPTTAGAIATAPGVATGRRSEVKFAFLTPLKPAEEAEPPELVAIRAELKKVPGFIDISGDENAVTVGYDAGLITVEQLMQKLADLKFPVKRQA
jgi:hypothetical protein